MGVQNVCESAVRRLGAFPSEYFIANCVNLCYFSGRCRIDWRKWIRRVKHAFYFIFINNWAQCELRAIGGQARYSETGINRATMLDIRHLKIVS